MKNAGLGGGFVAAAGEHVDASILNSGGATATINAALSTCDDAGANTNAAGQCLLVISSPTAGQTKAFATVTLLVGGVSLTRDSDSTTAAIGHGPGGTDEATKDWQGGPCPAAPSPFGLGAAGNYTVLGLAGAKLVISEGATKVTGNVGLGANGTGALLKAKIEGTLFLDPTAHPTSTPRT